MFNYKGRGSQFNPQNRFEKLYLDPFSYSDYADYYDVEDLSKKIPTQFFIDSSKSVIAENNSEDIGFRYSFNPYKGCEHGCVYCYARPTHEYLGFSSGLDFESKIMVKKDAPKLLENFFKKKNYKPDYIVFSGNTDCYQPVEKKLGITRKSLQVCLDYRNPVAVITKNALIMRDLDILQEMAKLNLVTVTLSITSLDPKLIRLMEPRTSPPVRRLETLELLAKNNIHCGINIAPVIPGLNDEEIPSIIKAAADHGAKFAGKIMIRLPFAVKDLFLNWLQKEFPDRAQKVENKIREIRNGKLYSSEPGKRFTGEGELANRIQDLFRISCIKYGLNNEKFDFDYSLFNNNPSQPGLF
jgi:DNA repair photolyase